jgi:hypothetical protein
MDYTPSQPRITDKSPSFLFYYIFPSMGILGASAFIGYQKHLKNKTEQDKTSESRQTFKQSITKNLSLNHPKQENSENLSSKHLQQENPQNLSSNHPQQDNLNNNIKQDNTSTQLQQTLTQSTVPNKSNKWEYSGYLDGDFLDFMELKKAF